LCPKKQKKAGWKRVSKTTPSKPIVSQNGKTNQSVLCLELPGMYNKTRVQQGDHEQPGQKIEVEDMFLQLV
jgi:hypothetical protein